MKVTTEWLRAYAKVPASWNTAVICEKLTMSGSEVEHIEVGAETTLTIEVTSNRTDCLSVTGVARELAVLADIPLTLPEKKDLPVTSTLAPVKTERRDNTFCPYYTAHSITGIRNCESPDWLKKRLIAVGLRPLNAVVDISNFVLFEYGQPMHTFDRDKITGNTIFVRPAKEGEKLLTLDGKERTLLKGDFVIADEKAPLALAGVMGGEASAVDDATTNILLESAWFQPQMVKEISLRHGLSSDSSFRFEREVNPAMVLPAARRCAELIVEICGGTLEEHIVIDGEKSPHQAEITLRLSRLARIMGREYPEEQVLRILAGLGFNPVAESDGVIRCTAPSFRPDCTREADLIEEVARIVGFDVVPESCSLSLVPVITGRKRRVRRSIHECLRSLGYNEVITDSFVPENKLWSQTPWENYGNFTAGHPVRKGEAQLRTTLLLSLLKTFQSNAQHSQSGRFYEDAHIYLMNADKKPAEQQVISFIAEEYESVRNSIDLLLAKINRPDFSIESFHSPLFAKNGGACLRQNGKLLLVFGLFSSALLKELGIRKKQMAGCEININLLETSFSETPRFKSFSRYPATLKDLSLVVDNSTLWKDVEKIARKAGGETLIEVNFLDEFRGKSIEPGKKSLHFSLVFQSATGTLQWEDVQKQFQAIIDEVCKQTGAELRSAGEQQ